MISVHLGSQEKDLLTLIGRQHAPILTCLEQVSCRTPRVAGAGVAINGKS